MSTVVAVFENVNAFLMEIFSFSRQKASIVNFFIVLVFALPCAFGFNIWESFAPLGAGTIVLDLEDFILSNNLLPLGALVYCLFCTHKAGWGWGNFIQEADTGSGPAFPKILKPWFSYVIPILIVIVFVMGYYDIFFK